MDVNDFQTIGECEIGYTWKVASENKVVVNIGKVALYFEVDEFFVFAKMIDDSAQNLMGERKDVTPIKKEEKPKIASIAKFRASKDNDEE
ncbi:MAG: hypothetical protein H7263_04380 [Candidatus Sericytochromatia bacterium]|nr:hypothetical protein [Candidatus Sericytochromatia bacterium]